MRREEERKKEDSPKGLTNSNNKRESRLLKDSAEATQNAEADYSIAVHGEGGKRYVSFRTYHDDNDDTLSLRQRVFRLYAENPYRTATEIMRILHEPDKEKMKLINNYLSQARHIITNLAYPKNPKLHKRTFVWTDVPRVLLFERFPMEPILQLQALGWELVANRNGMLVFRHDLGTVHWYENGTVMLYLRGEAPLARAKELFSKAFSFLRNEDLCRFLDADLRETLRHWVFETGQKLPRFEIAQFEKSHGLRIYSDGSHPTAVEVMETEPFWTRKLRETTLLLSQEIRGHSGLLHEWQEEAKEARAVLQGLLKRIPDLESNRRQANAWAAEGRVQKLCDWLNREIAFS